MEENLTIAQLTGTDEKFNCQCCGLELNDKKPEEICIDSFLWRVFAYLFCSEKCRDSYVDSK